MHDQSPARVHASPVSPLGGKRTLS
jgi:hypothetical protein